MKRLIKLPLEKWRFYLNVFSNKRGEQSRTGITVSLEKQSSEGSSQRLHIMKKTESTTRSAVLHKSETKHN